MTLSGPPTIWRRVTLASGDSDVGLLWRRVLDTNMLVSVTQKSRVGCPSRRKKHASGVHRQVEYTHFLALGDARTGSLRLLPVVYVI